MSRLMSVLLLFLLIVGCNGQQSKCPTRGQMYVGMSFGDALLTYDKSYKRFPDRVNEELNGRRITTIYRFWLMEDSQASNVFAKPSPYLLTFVGDRDENYEEIDAKRAARAEAILAANPQFAQELNEVCRKENVLHENCLVLLEVLYEEGFADLPPRPTSVTQLTQIEADYQTLDRMSQQAYRNSQAQLENTYLHDSPSLEPDAYGLGIHKNRYGQPVTLEPDFGGVPGEQLKIKPDAYGPGVHMDQYGRPVRENPWP